MARLTLYKDADVENTSISNLFIDEYMGAANDAQIKVYLYLIRMMNAKLATSVSDIADKFNHTEKDVIRALKYWEKQNLLDLDFDENKNLVGIHIRDLDSPRKSRRNAGEATFMPVPAVARQAEPVVPAAQEMLEEDPFKKPVYTADQLKKFKNDDNTAQLIFIAEAYFARPLTASEMQTLYYLVDVLHFTPDLVDYLLQYCVGHDHKSFRYIEKTALAWANEGITTAEQAENRGGKYPQIYYDIMRALGKSGSQITNTEAGYITKWIKEYQLDNNIVLEACDRTVLATDKNRFKYADGILTDWYHKDVRVLSDISKADEAFKRTRRTRSAGASAGNAFNQFEQRTYDFDALERELAQL